MCNQYTNEHVFVWISGDSGLAKPPDYLVCQCGQFRFDGKPAREIEAVHQSAYIIGPDGGEHFVYVHSLSYV